MIVMLAVSFLAFGAMVLLPRGGVSAQMMRGLSAAGLFTSFLAAVRNYLIRRRLGRATLTLSHWPLRRGQSVTAHFRAMLRKSQPVAAVTAKLSCVEAATIGRGRDEQKVRTLLYELDLACAAEKRQIIGEEWTITLPAEFPPSFEVVANKIEWWITVMLEDVPAEFKLLVVPR